MKPAMLAAFSLITGIFFPAASAVGQEERRPRPTQGLDPLIQRVVADVSEERIAAILKKLERFETRNTLSNPAQPDRGIGAARQWIFEQLKSYSPRLEVRFDAHIVPKGGRVWKEVELRNVVAILPGKMEEARRRWVVISGHYDSLNNRLSAELRKEPEKAAEIPAPGVTDDGSGTACVMESARVFSRYEFDATLVFVAFAGEASADCEVARIFIETQRHKETRPL